MLENNEVLCFLHQKEIVFPKGLLWCRYYFIAKGNRFPKFRGGL